ncbi:arylsulfatase [Litorimonas cladophorae]|uniref:Arylsulfatase n=1 Tax=Litorimonas cladophorae TaxID=1220491 RepID=A0A918KH62_9PROT|nr:arylsulfatase [Litorimonas cladophorae]GGX63148.1 arylsulfatase [Litorimonas cladophorae]
MKSSIVFAAIVVGAFGSLSGCAPSKTPTESSRTSVVETTRPNVLLIVADDLGYSDLGAFGGEIETPNLDALAMSGVRLTNFYAAPTCSPTRAMLMTGKPAHSVGLGAMAEALNTFKILKGKPGYEGYLHPEEVTIAEKFSAAGYRTMMTGKWHLGDEPDQRPTAQGFEKAYSSLRGNPDHFGAGQNGQPHIITAEFTENGAPVTYPVGAYSSDFLAEKMIDYIGSDASDEKPFFAYLAFTAPHWPLQAPKDLIAKYEGRYDAGPTVLRAERMEKMKALGLLDDAASAADLPALGDWEAMPAQQRARSARTMEIYAAMVDSVDQNVGKVLDHLKATGEFENTIVIFMSDNGAEGISQRPLTGRTSNTTRPDVKKQVLADIAVANLDFDKMGTSESFLTYGPNWAKAAMAPLNAFKGATEDGGIKAPAFVTGPGIKGGRFAAGSLHVMDIMPTAMDLTGITYEPNVPTSINGINAPSAISWEPILEEGANTVRGENDAMAWELFFKRGVRLGDWKAVYGKADPVAPPNRAEKSQWRLYNLKVDPAESKDVRAEHPDEFKRLMVAWDMYAEENGVFSPGPPKTPQ